MVAGPQHAIEVVAVELEVAGVVEVAEASGGGVEHLGNDGRLGVGQPVGDPSGIGQVPRVDLHRAQPAEAELLGHVVDHRPPHVELGHLDAVDGPEVLRWVLEEGPLVALEVGGQREGGRGHGIETKGVEDLDPHVDVAVGLGPAALGGVQLVGPEAVRGQRQQGEGHGQRRSRTPAGQPPLGPGRGGRQGRG